MRQVSQFLKAGVDVKRFRETLCFDWEHRACGGGEFKAFTIS